MSYLLEVLSTAIHRNSSLNRLLSVPGIDILRKSQTAWLHLSACGVRSDSENEEVYEFAIKRIV